MSHRHSLSAPYQKQEQDEQEIYPAQRPKTTERIPGQEKPDWFFDELQRLGFWKYSQMRICIEQSVQNTLNEEKKFGIYANYRIMNNKIDFESALPAEKQDVQTIKIPENNQASFNEYVQKYARSVGQLISIALPPRQDLIHKENYSVAGIGSTFNYVNFAGRNFGLGVYHARIFDEKNYSKGFRYYYMLVYDNVLKGLSELDLFDVFQHAAIDVKKDLGKSKDSDNYETLFKTTLVLTMKEYLLVYVNKLQKQQQQINRQQVDQNYLEYLQNIKDDRYEFIFLEQVENQAFLELRTLWDTRTHKDYKLQDPQIRNLKKLSFDYLFLDVEEQLEGRQLQLQAIPINDAQSTPITEIQESADQNMLQIGFNLEFKYIDYTDEYCQTYFLKNYFTQEDELIHVGKSLSYGKILKRNTFLQTFSSSVKYGSSGSLVVTFDDKVGENTFSTGAMSQQILKQDRTKKHKASTTATQKSKISTLVHSQTQSQAQSIENRFFTTALSSCSYVDERQKIDKKISRSQRKSLYKAEQMQNIASTTSGVILANEEEQGGVKRIRATQPPQTQKQKTIQKNKQQREDQQDDLEDVISGTHKEKNPSLQPQDKTTDDQPEKQSFQRNTRSSKRGISQSAILQTSESTTQQQQISTQKRQEPARVNTMVDEQIQNYEGKYNFNIGHTLNNPFLQEWTNCIQNIDKDDLKKKGQILKDQQRIQLSQARLQLWTVYKQSDRFKQQSQSAIKLDDSIKSLQNQQHAPDASPQPQNDRSAILQEEHKQYTKEDQKTHLKAKFSQLQSTNQRLNWQANNYGLQIEPGSNKKQAQLTDLPKIKPHPQQQGRKKQ